ncbi:MAG: zinc-ribbon domain-containing protein [Planctomycetaceae bacterium]
MLNTDLESDSIEIPEFVPLQEISAEVRIPVRGYFLDCPSCERELRINARFDGKKVSCKHCAKGFRFQATPDGQAGQLSVYVYCPHCRERLRMASKYVGVKVRCKHCSGQLEVTPLDRLPPSG